MDPITHKIRSYAHHLSSAQTRALKLIAKEGEIWQTSRGRWALPSQQAEGPYIRSDTIYALELRGLLIPDPKAHRGEIPRPRFLTPAGQALVEKLLRPG